MAQGFRASQVARVVKNPTANAGNTEHEGSMPGLGRSPGGGNGNPHQYSCLQKPTDWAAWWAAKDSDMTEHAHTPWVSSVSPMKWNLHKAPQTTGFAELRGWWTHGGARRALHPERAWELLPQPPEPCPPKLSHLAIPERRFYHKLVILLELFSWVLWDISANDQIWGGEGNEHPNLSSAGLSESNPRTVFPDWALKPVGLSLPPGRYRTPSWCKGSWRIGWYEEKQCKFDII